MRIATLATSVWLTPLGAIGPTATPEIRDKNIAKATEKMFKNSPPKR